MSTPQSKPPSHHAPGARLAAMLQSGSMALAEADGQLAGGTSLRQTPQAPPLSHMPHAGDMKPVRHKLPAGRPQQDASAYDKISLSSVSEKTL